MPSPFVIVHQIKPLYARHVTSCYVRWRMHVMGSKAMVQSEPNPSILLSPTFEQVQDRVTATHHGKSLAITDMPKIVAGGWIYPRTFAMLSVTTDSVILSCWLTPITPRPPLKLKLHYAANHLQRSCCYLSSRPRC